MNHKERCKELKKVRATIADKLGIDLHQRECTYEGECSGTCPKCAQEENILNKALLGGTIIASSIALCACGIVEGDQVDRKDRDGKAKNEKSDKKEKKEKTSKKKKGREEQIDGDLQIVGGETANITPTPEPVEIAGDIAVLAFSEDAICQAAMAYTGAPICELDSINDEGMYLIHCYEVVDNGDGDIHTATIDWLTVDPYNMTAVNFLGDEIDLQEFME